MEYSTKHSYGNDWIKWCDFCNYVDNKIYHITTDLAIDFICFLYRFELVTSGTAASKTLTGVAGTLVDFGINFQRSPLVTKYVKGFVRLRPPIRREKRPWSVYHCRLLFKHIIQPNINNFYIIAMTSMILIGYSGLLRPGELSKRQFNQTLNRNQIQFHPNILNPTDLIITLFHSKTNKIGKKERIIIPCVCNEKVAGIDCPCPVHHIKYYVSLRDAMFGLQGPLFVKDKGKRKGKPLSYYCLRTFLHKVIIIFNKYLPFDLDPDMYTPHCLRIGGTTDLARSGLADIIIQNRGRWITQIWRHIYVNLIWDDISLLSNKSISQLLKEAHNK